MKMQVVALAVLVLLTVSGQYGRREEDRSWASRFGGSSRFRNRIQRYSRRSSAFRNFWNHVLHHRSSHHHSRWSRYGRHSHHRSHHRSTASRNIVQLAQATPDLSTLVAAVVEAQLVNTLSGTGPFTVFAPTNAAFAKLPSSTLHMLLQPANRAKLQAILEYHVLSGKVTSSALKPFQEVPTVEGQTLDIRVRDGHVYVGNGGAQVKTANVMASNGVVHIIDQVLIPPSHGSHRRRPQNAPKNIVQLAQSVPQLSTLVQAVIAGSLVKTLSGPGPFTVFAPTNQAFNNLPRGALANLLAPQNKHELQRVLEYHVIPGRITSNMLQHYQEPRTVEGSELEIEVSHGHVYVGGALTTYSSSTYGAEVVQADVMASNGVVHVINAVLRPPEGRGSGYGRYGGYGN